MTPGGGCGTTGGGGTTGGEGGCRPRPHLAGGGCGGSACGAGGTAAPRTGRSLALLCIVLTIFVEYSFAYFLFINLVVNEG
jgi:hypothetical protein